jgi:hypothetical protein
MAQNMNVGVTLRLVDQFTGGVRAFQQQLQSLTQGIQAFNRAAGTGNTSPFGKIQGQVRQLRADVQQLVGGFQQLARVSSATSSGGGLVGSQVASMRQLLTLQQQAIANNARLASGGGRGPAGPGGPSHWGRRGFNPNASLADRAQYRAVNFMEQSLGEAILQPDIARTRLRRLDLSPETMALAEQAAQQYARVFPELTRGAILSTFSEIVTQFRSDAEGFAALPYLLRVQQLDIQAGRRPRDSMQGMLQLLRAVGLTGRLTDAEGNFTEQESAAVLDAYLRAREIVGADINPGGFLQLVKYMKSLAQTLSVPAILEAAVASPDVGHSTFGNQAAMLVRGLASSRATAMALEAQARWGLRTAEIDPRHPAGPHRLRPGALVDSVMMRDNPMEWWRKHILGRGGVLERMGLDPVRSSPAAIADALAPLFSNVSGENIANMFTQQQAEWRNQIERALRLNRGRPMWEMVDSDGRRLPLDEAAAGSVWSGLQRARARILDAMQSIGDNLTDFVLPPLNRFADILHTVSDLTNPRTGNPAVGMGVMAGGAVGAFMLARGILGRMGPWGRLLAGGAGGWMLGGDASTALMGALVARGMSAGAAPAAGAVGAAAVAGAAAGRAWGGRYLAVAGSILRGLRSMTLWGIGTTAVTEVITHWESIRARILGIIDEIRGATPTWLGGRGEGWGALGATPQGFSALPGDARTYGQGWGLWMRDTWPWSMMYDQGWMRRPMTAQERAEQAQHQTWLRSQGIDMGALQEDARLRAQSPSVVNVTGTTINVSISTQPGADARAIGDAAGNAVQSQLRGILADIPTAP